MTAADEELLARLNALREGSGRPPLRGWRRGRQRLEEAVAAEEAARAKAEALAAAGGSARRRRVVEALRAKTVERGCTPGEAEAARAKAEELATAAGGAPPRGAIGAMCAELLRTDLPYGEIVARVRARYPAARTTARSLASVAMDLRAAGVPVPPRRAGAT